MGGIFLTIVIVFSVFIPVLVITAPITKTQTKTVTGAKELSTVWGSSESYTQLLDKGIHLRWGSQAKIHLISDTFGVQVKLVGGFANGPYMNNYEKNINQIYSIGSQANYNFQVVFSYLSLPKSLNNFLPTTYTTNVTYSITYTINDNISVLYNILTVLTLSYLAIPLIVYLVDKKMNTVNSVSEITDNSNRCSHCGTYEDLNAVYCSNCGNQIFRN